MDIYSLLKDPWGTVGGRTVTSLNTELKREIPNKHPLSDRMLNAVARSFACDDVLYKDENSQHYYLVHLTWAKENNSEYPKYKIFHTFEDFIKYCRDTFEFNEEHE